MQPITNGVSLKRMVRLRRLGEAPTIRPKTIREIIPPYCSPKIGSMRHRQPFLFFGASAGDDFVLEIAGELLVAGKFHAEGAFALSH